MGRVACVWGGAPAGEGTRTSKDLYLVALAAMMVSYTAVRSAACALVALRQVSLVLSQPQQGLQLLQLRNSYTAG